MPLFIVTSELLSADERALAELLAGHHFMIEHKEQLHDSRQEARLRLNDGLCGIPSPPLLLPRRLKSTWPGSQNTPI